MNRILPVLAAFLAFTSCTAAQPRQNLNSNSDEASLKATMEECRQANIDGDVGRASACLTDDYHQTDISGYVQDKTTWMNEYFKPLAELIRAGKFRWETYERSDVQIRIHGDCAVVIGALHLKGIGARPGPQHTWIPEAGYTLAATLRFTHVYIRSHGKWLLTALHNQMMPATKQ